VVWRQVHRVKPVKEIVQILAQPDHTLAMGDADQGGTDALGHREYLVQVSGARPAKIILINDFAMLSDHHGFHATVVARFNGFTQTIELLGKQAQ